MKTLTLNEALLKAIAYCSTTERSLNDVTQKLADWGVLHEHVEPIQTHLLSERYVDLDRFTRAYIHDRHVHDKWGRIKIAQGLRLKGIDKQTITKHLADIPEDEYLSTLQNLLKKKIPSIKARNDYERNGKLIRFALSRGFEMSLICQCLHVDEE